MAFSSSSYFVGVGTALTAIAVGFAGGAMITTSTVQPPNRLERIAAGATPPASAPSSVTPVSTVTSGQASQPANVTTRVAQSPAIVAAPTPAIDSTPGQQPQPPAPVAARNEDATPLKNERTNARLIEPSREASRSADINREISRKRGDERKFSERKRRQDLVEATRIVRQMPRGGAVDRVVEEEDAPRFSDDAPRRFGLFGSDEDSPRAPPPPRFGLFGN